MTTNRGTSGKENTYDATMDGGAGGRNGGRGRGEEHTRADFSSYKTPKLWLARTEEQWRGLSVSSVTNLDTIQTFAALLKMESTKTSSQTLSTMMRIQKSKKNWEKVKKYQTKIWREAIFRKVLVTNG